MEIKEAMEILEKDIHTEVPKAAISARKHDAAVRMALVALEKQIPVEPIILDELNGDIDYECLMCGKQVIRESLWRRDMNKRTRKEMKHDQDQHYGGLIAHCDSDTAKESFSRPVYGSRQELEDAEQEKYLAEWNRRLKERKKRK